MDLGGSVRWSDAGPEVATASVGRHRQPLGPLSEHSTEGCAGHLRVSTYNLFQRLR